MIFKENFANFYDFSINFCQLADFLQRGGGPLFCKIFTCGFRCDVTRSDLDKTKFTREWIFHHLISIFVIINHCREEMMVSMLTE